MNSWFRHTLIALSIAAAFASGMNYGELKTYKMVMGNTVKLLEK